MHIKRMHDMIENLTECANSQFSKGMDCVDAEEMEKVAKMIASLSEAEYYSKVIKAMDEYSEDDNMRYYDRYRYKDGRFAPKGRGRRNYEEPYYHDMQYDDYEDMERIRDMDRNTRSRMYYTDSNMTSNNGNIGARDSREGRSGEMRRNYMETKETHKGNTQEDKDAKVKELERYMRSLSDDLTEMMVGMSPEEKTMLKAKLENLKTKVV